MAKPRQAESWYEQAADLMVRRNLNLGEITAQLGLALTSSEVENVRRSKAFETILWTVRNNYHAEIGRNPAISRDTLVGKMWVCAERLMEAGDFDKAGEVLLKIAKIKNMVGPELMTNVFGNLSQEDIVALKRRVAERLEVN